LDLVEGMELEWMGWGIVQRRAKRGGELRMRRVQIVQMGMVGELLEVGGIRGDMRIIITIIIMGR
jgi:hypothetical protein